MLRCLFALWVLIMMSCKHHPTTTAPIVIADSLQQVVLQVQTEGASLFKAKCSVCHPTDKHIDGYNVFESNLNLWESKEMLQLFIQNSANARRYSAYASTLYETYNHVEAHDFPDLTIADINLLINYIKFVDMRKDINY